MSSTADSARERFCLLCALGAALLALIVGTTVLLGWIFEIPALRNVLPGIEAMQPVTALCFVLCGLALTLHSDELSLGAASPVPTRAAQVAAVLSAAISLTNLVEYASHLDLIDVLLLHQTALATHVPHLGRMDPGSAMGLLLISLALSSLDGKVPWAAQLSAVLALLAGLMGLIAVLRDLYGVEAAYRLFAFLSGALHTALLLIVLALGTLFSRPRRGLCAVIISDLSGGWMARRLLPIAILAPIGITWLRLSGQRAGLYGPDFGLALYATSNVIIFAAVICLGAKSLNELDRQRRLADQATKRYAEELADTNEQLRVSEQRFRLFMNHLPAAAFLKDAEGRYLWGNAAWRKQFPDELGDLTGKTDADLWPPDTAQVFAASDERVRDGGVPFQLSETTRIGGDLRQRLVSKFPVQAAGGGVLIGGVAFDTTESKRLENQLYQAQKLEAIGLLAGGVAHDFNNLLTIILGYADIGKGALQDRETLRRSLDEIQNAGMRAAALTTQLLAFGRKQVIQPRLISVNHELTEIYRMLRRIVREDIALTLLLAPDIGVVKTDPVQIQQILLNLAMNAQDAMPEGGKLTIETANVDLDASYDLVHRDMQAGPYVLLAVTDTGTGMDSLTLAHLFEPFFTTKAAGKGTGLGLATVYGIVKQSGGHIWVYSEPGKGTSFKIYLPRVEGAAATRAEEIQPSETARRAKPSETLLIVEDEESVRSLMVTACRDAGYRVLEAACGEEGVALIADHKGMIHLLVTDVIMPGISGRILADQLRERRPETKVLFCSGYAENAVVHHGVLAPDVEFLQKPFTAVVLLNRIRSLLGQS